jgi:hypothetical protein
MTTDCLLGTQGIVSSADAVFRRRIYRISPLALILLALRQEPDQAQTQVVPAADSGLRGVCTSSNHHCQLDNEPDTHRLSMVSRAEIFPIYEMLPCLRGFQRLSTQRPKRESVCSNRGIPSTLATARYRYKGTCFCVDHVQSASWLPLQ